MTSPLQCGPFKGNAEVRSPLHLMLMCLHNQQVLIHHFWLCFGIKLETTLKLSIHILHIIHTHITTLYTFYKNLDYVYSLIEVQKYAKQSHIFKYDFAQFVFFGKRRSEDHLSLHVHPSFCVVWLLCPCVPAHVIPLGSPPAAVLLCKVRKETL